MTIVLTWVGIFGCVLECPRIDHRHSVSDNSRISQHPPFTATGVQVNKFNLCNLLLAAMKNGSKSVRKDILQKCSIGKILLAGYLFLPSIHSWN